MALRCLLFCSDAGTAQPVCRTLADLGIEVEHCPVAQAVQRITSELFHLVIVDWDDQPEAAFLLNTGRERKAAERPLALAIVGNDASVPQALQAGANSILRKPIQVTQAKETLSTAQGLLRAKYESAALTAAAAASGGTPVKAPGTADHTKVSPGEKTLRAGEFLQSGATPSTQFVTETEVPKSLDHLAETEIGPLKNLEPMAAAVEKQDAVRPSVPQEPDEPRGLSWYLKARPAPVPPAPEPAPRQAELLSLSETPSYNQTSENAGASEAAHAEASPAKASEHEQRAEAALFAHISGKSPEEAETRPRRSLGKLATAGVMAAVILIAYAAIPQSTWRPKVQSLFAGAARAGHNWLNPQPVTTPQAPASHENFGRAGDEYKLPVAESIPDATTDPSQIRVLPVIDPTAKQPNGANGAAQNAAAVNTAAKDVPDPSPPDPAQAQQSPEGQSSQAPQVGSVNQATGSQSENGAVQTPTQSVPVPVQPETRIAPPATVPSTARRNPQPRTPAATNNAIPSSLKSQMASTTPEAGGNKPVEAALPSIEPVDLPEAAARYLILQQPDPVYPENAKGQQGMVVLQLLIGRDGSVEDAKFLQGSLAFARAATDAVRHWQFKPYTLNARPVSVRTVLTLHFKPAS